MDNPRLWSCFASGKPQDRPMPCATGFRPWAWRSPSDDLLSGHHGAAGLIHACALVRNSPPGSGGEKPRGDESAGGTLTQTGHVHTHDDAGPTS